MSRSFHVTRKSVKQARKITSCNPNRIFAEEQERLEEQYDTKHRTKNQVRRERKNPSFGQLADSIDTLPIEVADQSPYLHYPVKEEDIRALLKLMPQGLADGLSKFTFCLGKQQQSLPDSAIEENPQRDPYFSRIGYTVFEDVYRPRCLGTYFVKHHEIKLYGYVYNPRVRDKWLCEFYLRLHMLATLIHELAHHHDLSCRVARGRWRMDDLEKAENYAEQMAGQWINEYVIPYMENACSKEYGHLRQWMKEKIGIVVPLSVLLGKCCCTAKQANAAIKFFFNTSTAFEEFVGNIQSGRNLILSRIDFANKLHMAEEYDYAMKILDTVLAGNPKQVDALCVYGDIFWHLDQPLEAIRYAKKALRCERRDCEAIQVLCRSYESLKDWRLMFKWACAGIQAAEDFRDELWFKRDYIKALLELGKIESAQKAFKMVKEEMGKRRLPIFLRRIESELKKKTGKRK